MYILKHHLKSLLLCLLQKATAGIFLELLTHHKGIKELLLSSVECAVLDWMSSCVIFKFFFLPPQNVMRELCPPAPVLS